MRIFKYLGILLACLISYALFSDNDFVRINDENRTVELAIKTYENTNTRDQVKLIAMFHLGDREFYDQVRENIKGLTLLYENYGLSLKDIEEASKRVKSLGDSIAQIYSSPELSSFLLTPAWTYTIALALGLVHQSNYLSYDTAAELIHADIGRKKEAKLNKISDEVLADKLKKSIGFLGLNFPNLCQKTAEYGYFCLNWVTWLLGAKEKFFRNVVTNIHENKEYAPDFYERNNIVIKKLKSKLVEENSPKDIAITYGAEHMPFIENYLLENGFKLKSVDWIVLTGLDQK